MSIINYADLKIENVEHAVPMQWGDHTITVAQRLSIQDKCDLIESTLRQSEENGVYSLIKLDAYFHLNLIFLYTNVAFTEEERADEAALFDALESSGFMDAFMKVINAEEYNYLYDTLLKMAKIRSKHNNTISGLANKLLVEMPEAMELAKNVMESFDKEKFAEVMAFAKAANGGRDIPAKN